LKKEKRLASLKKVCELISNSQKVERAKKVFVERSTCDAWHPFLSWTSFFTDCAVNIESVETSNGLKGTDFI